jgi:hypothetical protein
VVSFFLAFPPKYLWCCAKIAGIVKCDALTVVNVKLYVGEWIILGWILERRDGVMTGLFWLRIGTVGELL